MERSTIEEYKGKHVIIGLPHRFDKDSLFFYDGILSGVGVQSVTLQLRDETQLSVDIDIIKSIKIKASSGATDD